MKRLLCLLLIALMLSGASVAEEAAVLLPNLNVTVSLPADWTVETNTDEKQAILTATVEGGQLLLYVDRSLDCDLDGFKELLQKGMERGNGTSALDDVTYGERRFLTTRYDREMPEGEEDFHLRDYVCQLRDGAFLMLSFRVRGDRLPDDVFADVFETILSSVSETYFRK